MRTLRLLGKDGYTNAAAILADKNDSPGIDCVRFGDTEDVILDRETTTNVSAIEQVDRAVAMFARYYRFERIEGMERVQTDRISLEAFREAVANALVHRTWDVRANVQIALYDDRVVVTSPGSLPAGLTTEQYLYGQISVLRNPIVAEVFLKLDYSVSPGSTTRARSRSTAVTASSSTLPLDPTRAACALIRRSPWACSSSWAWSRSSRTA